MLVAALPLLASCGTPLGHSTPPHAMSDIKLLAAYGMFHDNQFTSQGWRQEVEREVQRRNLLTVAEVMQIQAKKTHMGASSALALANRGIPHSWGVSPRHPGVEVWIYPVSYPRRVDQLFFFSKGRLIGWRAMEAVPNKNGINELQVRSAGRLYRIDYWQITRCQRLGDSPCAGLRITTDQRG